jgi:hypothetical protein
VTGYQVVRLFDVATSREALVDSLWLPCQRGGIERKTYGAVVSVELMADIVTIMGMGTGHGRTGQDVTDALCGEVSAKPNIPAR